MARPGLDQQDVFEACDTLKKKGESVTIENVRHLLKTGSNSTIGRHLTDWKYQQRGKEKKSLSYWDGYNDAISDVQRMLNRLKR